MIDGARQLLQYREARRLRTGYACQLNAPGRRLCFMQYGKLFDYAFACMPYFQHATLISY